MFSSIWDGRFITETQDLTVSGQFLDSSVKRISFRSTDTTSFRSHSTSGKPRLGAERHGVERRGSRPPTLSPRRQPHASENLVKHRPCRTMSREPSMLEEVPSFRRSNADVQEGPMQSFRSIPESNLNTDFMSGVEKRGSKQSPVFRISAFHTLCPSQLMNGAVFPTNHEKKGPHKNQAQGHAEGPALHGI